MAAPSDATDLVLLAHGGLERSLAAPRAWRPPILRMWPLALAARSAAPDAAIGLMRYRYRGWNAPSAHPAEDLRTVLDRLTTRFNRVLLIGHSMGGRAIIAAGNHPLVSGVLALAPWLPDGEPLVALRGPVVLAHGDLDRITDPRQTAQYAARLRIAGHPVGLLTVTGEKHAMLHRSPDWSELAHRFVDHALTATPCDWLSITPSRVDPLPHWNPTSSLTTGIRDITIARLRLHVVSRL
ncbi:putative esterase [Kribbella sp. VKM Ac-2527]|uniref:Putative esterase n=1 Tax=Kribbella caucasensis TaxID=2512215 RepID=A0A4R6KG76_9ACTN|nr:putative esterase [Kribbella sp. VKM Ac-2527]